MKQAILALLAVAALAAPATAAATTGESAAGLRADGLRWQAVAASYRPAAGESAAGLRADGLRWQAEARAYRTSSPRDRVNTLAYALISLGVVVAGTCGLLAVRARRRDVVHSTATPSES
jgi:hypothetical protein